jgi:hypothetical protein
VEPEAQSATIAYLIQAGANPNAKDNSGVAPLHRAVRTRCAAAVRALLVSGADARGKNKRGSTPLHLAVQNTGRGGTGSAAARAEQQETFACCSAMVRAHRTLTLWADRCRIARRATGFAHSSIRHNRTAALRDPT